MNIKAKILYLPQIIDVLCMRKDNFLAGVFQFPG